jgi:ABC-type phosphate/phosphonate transport system ATPase subunit
VNQKGVSPARIETRFQHRIVAMARGEIVWDKPTEETNIDEVSDVL